MSAFCSSTGTTILCPEYPSEGIASNPCGYPCIICKFPSLSKYLLGIFCPKRCFPIHEERGDWRCLPVLARVPFFLLAHARVEFPLPWLLNDGKISFLRPSLDEHLGFNQLLRARQFLQLPINERERVPRLPGHARFFVICEKTERERVFHVSCWAIIVRIL